MREADETETSARILANKPQSVLHGHGVLGREVHDHGECSMLARPPSPPPFSCILVHLTSTLWCQAQKRSAKPVSTYCLSVPRWCS